MREQNIWFLKREESAIMSISPGSEYSINHVVEQSFMIIASHAPQPVVSSNFASSSYNVTYYIHCFCFKTILPLDRYYLE